MHAVKARGDESGEYLLIFNCGAFVADAIVGISFFRVDNEYFTQFSASSCAV